jgi:O-antigen/teichoic acid export membrane protein
MKHFSDHSKLALVSQGIASGGNFLLGAWAARILGLEAFGQYALYFSAIYLILSLHQATVTKPMLSIGNKETAYIVPLQAVQALFVSGIGLAGILSAGIAHYWVQSWSTSILMVALIIPGFLQHDFNKKAFFLKEQFLLPILLDSLLYSAIFIAFFLFGKTLMSLMLILAAAYTVSGLAGSIILLQSTKLSIASIGVEAIRKIIKKHYHFSKWLLGTALLQWSTGNIFLILSAGIVGNAAAGALRMAQHFVGLCHIMFLAMENLVPAKASLQLFTGGKTALYRYLSMVAIKGGIATLLLLISMSIAAPWIIPLAYGPTFQEYTYVIWGFCLLYVFVFLNYPLRFALRSLEDTRPIFTAYLATTLFTLISAAPMIRQWGLSGLVGGLILCQFISTGFYLHALRQSFKPLFNAQKTWI